jgi:hypothetical protein
LAQIELAWTAQDEVWTPSDAHRGCPQYAQSEPAAEALDEAKGIAADAGGLRRLDFRGHPTVRSARHTKRRHSKISCRSSMRKLPKPTEQEIIEGPQAISFQIANGNVRQSCILQTSLPTKIQAQKYLLANWPAIEKMARDALAAGAIEGGQIKLEMI